MIKTIGRVWDELRGKYHYVSVEKRKDGYKILYDNVDTGLTTHTIKQARILLENMYKSSQYVNL